MKKQQSIKRLLINILSEKLEESKEFYIQLFDFRVDYDSDWFVHLIAKNGFELGILKASSTVTPPEVEATYGGYYLTFVVDDVDEVYEQCKAAGVDILEAPRSLDYGQRRLLLKDPNGVVLDVSSPVE